MILGPDDSPQRVSAKSVIGHKHHGWPSQKTTLKSVKTWDSYCTYNRFLSQWGSLTSKPSVHYVQKCRHSWRLGFDMNLAHTEDVRKPKQSGKFDIEGHYTPCFWEAKRCSGESCHSSKVIWTFEVKSGAMRESTANWTVWMMSAGDPDCRCPK